MNTSFISKATLGRIPIYIQYLKELPDDSGDMISATKIARGLSLGEVQVRKDLASISSWQLVKSLKRIRYSSPNSILPLTEHYHSHVVFLSFQP